MILALDPFARYRRAIRRAAEAVNRARLLRPFTRISYRAESLIVFSFAGLPLDVYTFGHPVPQVKHYLDYFQRPIPRSFSMASAILYASSARTE